GMIGRGKTRLVCSIIQHLFHNKVPSLIFDIKGEYAATFATEPNVEIFTIGAPHPLCINLFDTNDEDDVSGTLLVIEEMMVSSNQEFSPSMKNLFETALFLTHKAEVRTLETFVENLIALAKKTKQIKSIQHTLDAVLNRLNYIFNPISFEILGVSQTTLNFDMLEQGKSIILDLSQFQKRAARPSDIYLICNLILKLFYKYASSKELTNKLRYVVVLEEAINIIPNFYRKQSSASLITAENNFLLGRSLGIGHITISQMWNSVSNVVHANSSTKIVFRSGQEIEKIAKALNLKEFHFNRLQQLPIRHCFVWKDGQEYVTEMTTINFTLDPLKYNHYLLLLKRKYHSSTYPLLFNNFIDMRTALYDKLTNTKKPKQKKKEKPVETNQISKKKSNSQKEIRDKVEQFKKIFSEEIEFELDDVCFTFCSLSKDKKKCKKIRKDAEIASSALLKRFTKHEIEQAILGTSNVTLENLLKQVALKNKLSFNKQMLICAQRELINLLMKND
ncbi:MAG: ATP-binding protein, partial [Candidatus Heimdallarchaeota archaeon]|nr:ATP-binding protein [Candidatus Heimdallarchaeota archaeon]MCK4610198.1 ATP-binding protein [Candidatus Heimdallarchaeota archaeon]